MTGGEGSRTGGFSLIETLVALFVIALISTASGAMLLDTLRASERVEGAAVDIRELEIATGFFRSDLAAMTRRASTGPDSYLPPAGPTGTNGARDGLVLSFVRGGWSMLGEGDALRSDLIRIEYHRTGNTLVRRAYAAPDPTARTPVAERVLIDEITDLSFRYFSAGGWSDQWETPAGSIDPLLPELVEIVIVDRDGRTLNQKLLAGGRFR